MSTEPEIQQVSDVPPEDRKCPLCQRIFRGYIYVCTNGHNICGKCRKTRQPTCPHCEEESFDIRNCVMEERMKAYFKASKPEFYGPKNLRHNLFYGPTQGKGNFRCRAPGCKANLPICRLLNHCRTFHSQMLTEIPKGDYVKPFEANYLMTVNNNYYAVYHISRFGLFFFNVQCYRQKRGTNVHGWLQIAAPSYYARRIEYVVSTFYYGSKGYYKNFPSLVKTAPEVIMKRRECSYMHVNGLKEDFTADLLIKDYGSDGKRKRLFTSMIKC